MLDDSLKIEKTLLFSFSIHFVRYISSVTVDNDEFSDIILVV